MTIFCICFLFKGYIVRKNPYPIREQFSIFPILRRPRHHVIAVTLPSITNHHAYQQLLFLCSQLSHALPSLLLHSSTF